MRFCKKCENLTMGFCTECHILIIGKVFGSLGKLSVTISNFDDLIIGEGLEEISEELTQIYCGLLDNTYELSLKHLYLLGALASVREERNMLRFKLYGDIPLD